MTSEPVTRGRRGLPLVPGAAVPAIGDCGPTERRAGAEAAAPQSTGSGRGESVANAPPASPVSATVMTPVTIVIPAVFAAVFSVVAGFNVDTRH